MNTKKPSYFITLDDPCTEEWNNMTPVEQGRHCSKCNKTVIDLSTSTDKQIIDFISAQKGKIFCGQFDATQLNRWIVDNDVQQTNPALYKVLLSMLLLSSSVNTNAQKQLPDVTISTSVKYSKKEIILNNSQSHLDRIEAIVNPLIKPLPKPESKILLRGGISSFNSVTPIYIINGSTVTNEQASNINPHEIISVNVLKDAEATALYGAKGAAGVIIITTKNAEQKQTKKKKFLFF